MDVYLNQPEVGTILVFRDKEKRRVRKPRKLSCGYDAKVGDIVVVTEDYRKDEKDYFRNEECERCDAHSHGYEYDGPKHGNI